MGGVNCLRDECTRIVLNYRHAELPNGTLSWAFDDEDAPTEITIFDPQNEITTRWIAIDKDYVCDLNESV